jgi:hypothetical protein
MAPPIEIAVSAMHWCSRTLTLRIGGSALQCSKKSGFFDGLYFFGSGLFWSILELFQKKSGLFYFFSLATLVSGILC